MTKAQIEKRIEQTIKLREICKANGNEAGRIIHDKTLSRLSMMAYRAREEASRVRLYACRQA